MKNSNPDIATMGVVGVAMIGAFVCFPFFIAAQLGHEASVVIGKAASRGNFVHEIFYAAYSPFTASDMSRLTFLGFVYALIPVAARILPGRLGVLAFRVAAGYTWIGFGLFLVLGAATALAD